MTRVLVILANLLDALDVTLTREQAQGWFNTTATDFFAEISYGKCQISCDVRGWVTAQLTAAQAQVQMSAWNFVPLAEAAVAALGSAVDYTQYQHLVVFTPWPYNGIGGLGLPHQVINTPSGPQTYQVAVVNDQNKTDSTPGFNLTNSSVLHEMLHCFGAVHDNLLTCPLGGPALPTGSTAECATAIYGNVYSVMGASQPGGHPSPENKTRWLGWLTVPNLLELTGTDPVPVLLEPYETIGSGIKAVRWQRTARSWFYLEFRQPLGRDAAFLNMGGRYPDVFNGILVSLTDPITGQPVVLDTSPSFVPGTYTGVDLTYNSVALLPGQTFTDQATGFSVTTHSIDTSGAAITVTPGVTDLTAPAVVLTSPFTIGSYPCQYPLPSIDVAGLVPFTVTASPDTALIEYKIAAYGQSPIKIGASRIGPDFAVQWDSTKHVNGLVNMFAVAYDAAGNTAQTCSIELVIYNEAPPPPPPPPPPPISVSILNPSSGLVIAAGASVKLYAQTVPTGLPVKWAASKGSISGSTWTAPRQRSQECIITATTTDGKQTASVSEPVFTNGGMGPLRKGQG